MQDTPALLPSPIDRIMFAFISKVRTCVLGRSRLSDVAELDADDVNHEGLKFGCNITERAAWGSGVVKARELGWWGL